MKYMFVVRDEYNRVGDTGIFSLPRHPKMAHENLDAAQLCADPSIRA